MVVNLMFVRRRREVQKLPYAVQKHHKMTRKAFKGKVMGFLHLAKEQP